MSIPTGSCHVVRKTPASSSLYLNTELLMDSDGSDSTLANALQNTFSHSKQQSIQWNPGSVMARRPLLLRNQCPCPAVAYCSATLQPRCCSHSTPLSGRLLKIHKIMNPGLHQAVVTFHPEWPDKWFLSFLRNKKQCPEGVRRWKENREALNKWQKDWWRRAWTWQRTEIKTAMALWCLRCLERAGNTWPEPGVRRGASWKRHTILSDN